MVMAGAPGGLEAGDLDNPITTAGATRTGHAFLDDIAHHAVPRTGFDRGPGHRADSRTRPVPAGRSPRRLRHRRTTTRCSTAHFIAGDGRVNENIGLTAVHHIFHSEHNRLRE